MECDYLSRVIAIATEAGAILSTHFHSIFTHKIKLKSDKTPVTQADIAANQFITAQLTKLDSTIPVLSEETNIPDFAIRTQWKKYWLVDPLDGTRGFIKHSPEFCVNIALIENHYPILGVIYSPIEKICYYASKNQGAFRLRQALPPHSITCAKRSSDTPLRFLCSHFDNHHPLKNSLHKILKNVTVMQMNSAIKFGVIACGDADLYVRFGKTSEWDTAAGQCIVTEAGGAVVDFQGQPLQYNAKSSLINPSFMAVGDMTQLNSYLVLNEITRSNL